MPARTELGGRTEQCRGYTGQNPTDFTGRPHVAGMMCATSRAMVAILYLVLFARNASSGLEVSSSVAASVAWFWSRFRVSRQIPAILGDRRHHPTEWHRLAWE